MEASTTMPFDMRILRSFRCLRPLKMLKKLPSKFFGIVCLFCHVPNTICDVIVITVK